MLKFYGLYKQAVEGPCTEPKPAFYEVVKGYKWQAWRALGNMTKAEAKNCYVDELKKVSGLWEVGFAYFIYQCSLVLCVCMCVCEISLL